MNLLTAAMCGLFALLLALAGVSRAGAWLIERRYPPVGDFAEVEGTKVHHVYVPAESAADLPPLVFIHGASGNLLDQMVPVRPLLEGRAEMLFLDRPGHGWSQRGAGNGDPVAQAHTIAALMDQYDMQKAVIVGHSFGGSVAAAFAVEHPEKTAGLVFLSAATHPWPGGATSWYYKLSSLPVLGRLFVETLAWPGGTLQMGAASACVFAPNRMPESYLADAAIPLVLRASAFRWNATDVAGLYDHVAVYSKRYGEIAAPTIVISGNRDTVVYEEIHSVGLARDIPGADMIWVDNLGHKPDWVAPDLVVAAIEKVSGKPVDLQAAVKKVEARIADDAYGPACPDEKPELSAAG
ncbi:MAG: alpha/beta hydrolase [Aquamicrobium sp.]|nr:alpha/beta hydrolase [Aquamicrobium sp.]